VKLGPLPPAGDFRKHPSPHGGAIAPSRAGGRGGCPVFLQASLEVAAFHYLRCMCLASLSFSVQKFSMMSASGSRWKSTFMLIGLVNIFGSSRTI